MGNYRNDWKAFHRKISSSHSCQLLGFAFEELVDFAGQLTEIGVPHIVVSFGNPYLITELPDVRAYMLAWSGSEASQTAAAQALFGEIEISGSVPTRIPPLYEIGDGIMISKKLNGNDRD